MTAPPASGWWTSSWSVALAVIAATIPLWFVTLPPLIDLLGHMGRYHIQLNLAHNAALAANWDYHWRLIGNLGCDLLMEPLGRVFGVERGSVILAGLILVLMISGMARLARAVHGYLPATAWAAFPFAMTYPWQYGLVNYWLGVACAFHAAAWVWPMAASWRRGVVLGVLSVLLWVVHIYGWAIFAVLIGAQAATAVTRMDWFRPPQRVWPLAAPLIPMLVMGYGARGSQETYGWFMWGRKLSALSYTLRDQWQGLDIASLVLAGLLIFTALVWRKLRIDRGMGLAALLLLAAVVIIPYQLLGSAFADGRVWPVVFIVALLAIRPTADASPAVSHGIASAAVLIFAVRIAATTVGFQAYDAAYARHLKALNAIPRGSRVAVFLEFPCEVAWRRPRLDHMDSLAIVRRDAFTNGQWDVPGAQTLVPLAARGTRFNADPSQLVRRPDCPADLRPVLTRRIDAFPRDRFDLVWVIGFRPETLPRYPALIPVFADDRTILYRIDK